MLLNERGGIIYGRGVFTGTPLKRPAVATAAQTKHHCKCVRGWLQEKVTKKELRCRCVRVCV